MRRNRLPPFYEHRRKPRLSAPLRMVLTAIALGIIMWCWGPKVRGAEKVSEVKLRHGAWSFTLLPVSAAEPNRLNGTYKHDDKPGSLDSIHRHSGDAWALKRPDGTVRISCVTTRHETYGTHEVHVFEGKLASNGEQLSITNLEENVKLTKLLKDFQRMPHGSKREHAKQMAVVAIELLTR